MLVTRRDIDPAALLSTHARELASAEAALDLLRHRGRLRFFPGVADVTRTATLIGARLPEERCETIAAADALLKRRFNLLGYHSLWFGDPIDWHLDPVSSRRFFFQAEDGIRVGTVTGVQTCALPI